MQMVEPDAESVEARLQSGEMVCARCCGEVRPWGHARWRTLRDHGRQVRLRPRRSRCRECLVSHVLRPTLVLLRRVDVAAVIGTALVARHVECRRRAEVARAAGAPWDTVRGWLRRSENERRPPGPSGRSGQDGGRRDAAGIGRRSHRRLPYEAT
jgi:hypothetical protein